MNVRQLVKVATILSLVMISGMMLSFIGSSDADTSNVDENDGGVKTTPDGLYSYSYTTIYNTTGNDHKSNGSWTDSYVVTDENGNKYEYTVTVTAQVIPVFNMASYTVSEVSDTDILIIESPDDLYSETSSLAISSIPSDCSAVYFIGNRWSVTATFDGGTQTIFTDCDSITLSTIKNTSSDRVRIVSYLNSERFIQIGGNVDLVVIWDGTGDPIFGSGTEAGCNIIYNKQLTTTFIFLPIDVYLNVNSESQYLRPYSESDEIFVERQGMYYYVGDFYAEDVVVPSNVDSIAERCFYRMTNLESVTFEGNVESIGEMAFFGCTSLETIALPSSLTSIGASAFSSSGLTAVEFETGGTQGLDLSARGIFSGTSVAKIEFPARTTAVGEILNGCTSLNELTFEESDSYMLWSFQQVLTGFSLTKLYMPMPSDGNFPSIPSILDFRILGQSDDVIVRDGITYIKDEKGDLTILHVPGDISGTISLPDGLTEIPSAVFYQSNIQSIAIPASVTSIGASAFWGSSLETIFFAEDSKLQSIGQNAFYDTAIKEITLSGPLQSIGRSAFGFCGNLETVTIDGTNLEIGDSVFTNCGSLTTVNLSADSLTIGSSAFYGTALTGIELPEGTTSIGGSAFTGTRLATIYIPSTVTSMGLTDSSSPFPRTLRDITVDSDNTKYLSEENVVYEIAGTGDSTTYKLVFVGYGVTELVMKAGTTDMLENVFRSHASLQKVVFPEGFPADIGYTAFQGCSSLTTVDASNASFVSIEQGAFNNTPLTQISFPATLTTIGVNAFLNCSELTALDLSGTKLSSVGNGAFTGCTSLVSVSLPSTLETWPGFSDSGKLSKVTIDSKNLNLESVDGVMVISKGSKTLTYVVPNVPRDDDGLRSVTIPKDVTSIDITAFRNATLDAVYIEAGNTAMSSMENGAAAIGTSGAVLYIASAVESIELPDTVKSLSSNVLEYATSLKRLAWGDSDTTGNLSIPSDSSGLDEIVLTTKGSVTMGSMTFNNISSISVTCGSLSVTSITSQSDYDLSISAGSISGEGFIRGSVASISISGTAAESVDVGELLGNGTYDAIDVIINGEAVDIVKALTGHTLKVQDSEGGDIPFEIASVIKDDDGFSFVFLFDYQDFTVYDVDAIVDNAALDISGNGFVVDVGSADVTVTISEKSESSITHTVTFDPAGGSLPGDSDTLRVGHGRTISTSQLNSMEPSRDGYVFKGWYTDAILSNAYDRMQITDDMTLYARWEPVNGHVVGIDDPYGRVTATYPDGRVFYSGDRVEDGTVLTLEFRTGNGIDLLGWTVTAGGTSTTAEAGTLEVTVSGTM